MDMLSTIIAGTVATFGMTLLMVLASFVTGYNLRIPQFLGTMLTFETKPSGDVSRSSRSLLLGNFAHYCIGVCFALLYKQIHPAFYKSTSVNGLLFGMAAGGVALIFWGSAFRLHPLAPKVNLPLYLAFIFLGHLLFGATLQIILNLFHK